MEREVILREVILREWRLACIGGLVADVAALLAIMSVSPLDDHLHISICLLSVAIPTLIFSITTIDQELNHQGYQESLTSPWYFVWSCWGGLTTTMGAFTGIFMHFSEWYGWIFGIISVVGMLLFIRQDKVIFSK